MAAAEAHVTGQKRNGVAELSLTRGYGGAFTSTQGASGVHSKNTHVRMHLHVNRCAHWSISWYARKLIDPSCVASTTCENTILATNISINHVFMRHGFCGGICIYVSKLISSYLSLMIFSSIFPFLWSVQIVNFYMVHQIIGLLSARCSSVFFSF